MKTKDYLLIPLLVALAIAACTGCGSKGGGWRFASWDMRKWGREPAKPDPEIPARLATTWIEAVHNRPGEPAQRGFGGRISFFKPGSEDPIRVDGQLVVYAFDETSRPEYETQPTRRYVFPPEQFAVHESETKLGPSYSVWLPWDNVGGNERKISLIAKFEPHKGAAVVSEQTKHYLAGPPEPKQLLGEQQQLATAPAASGVQTAAYMQDAGASVPQVQPASLLAADRLATTTIPLPSRLAATPGTPRRTRAIADAAGLSAPTADQTAPGEAAAETPIPAAAGGPTGPQAARAPQTTAALQLPGDMPTTGYLTPPGFLGGRQSSGGSQWGQPQVQARQSGR
jgi:hypothetical protein